MSLVKTYKWSTIDEVTHFLEGGIFGGGAATIPRSGGGPGIFGLVGKKMTFTQPSGSVTFVTGGDPQGFLTYLEIKAQIEAAVSGTLVKLLGNGKMGLIEATPTTGLILDGDNTADTEANSYLGFDSKHPMTGRVYGSPYAAAPPTAPYYLNSYIDNNNCHVLVVFE